MVNKSIYNIIIIFINTIILFLITDFIFTKSIKVRGFSKFFESNEKVGYINKRNFSGKFGGPLDEFYVDVEIDKYGNRKSSLINCSSKNEKQKTKKVIFVGDSNLAAFEVPNEMTYVSILNKKCIDNFEFINGGVRAHDTHMAIANLKRIVKEYKLTGKDFIPIYMLSNNDFMENDNKNIYFSLKSKFGSIFDNEFYKPSVNSNINQLRVIVGDNFYLSTKLLLISESVKINLFALFGNEIINYWQGIKIDSQRCKRVINIIEKSLEDTRINKIYVAVHPKFTRLNQQSKNHIKCLEESAINSKINIFNLNNKASQIKMETDLKKYNFEKDGHYNEKGHAKIAEILIYFFKNKIIS